jgi:hypothetical protein
MRHFRVFVSSPGDVADERRAAHEILRTLPEEPAWMGKISIHVVRWDNPHSPTPMYANYTPQEAVNLQLPTPSRCDLVVLMLWSRFGTPLKHPVRPDGSQYLSGTEWEYEDAHDANVRILVFRCLDDPLASLRDPDVAERQRQLGLVDAFFERLVSGGTGGFTSYKKEEFESKFKRIVESALRQFLETEPSGPSGEPADDIIKRLTKQLEEKERENVRLRQMVLKTVASDEHFPAHTTGRGRAGAVEVQVETLDDAQVDAARRQSDVVAVASVLPMKLIAPIAELAVADQPPIAWGVSAVGADKSPYSGNGVVVAILDTGIDSTHPAFAGVELVERDFSGEGNGDRHGHGTHFAGTVFGRNVNGVRIGVAPGIKKALIGKIIGAEGTSSDVVVNAIQWAVEAGADLIAMSLTFDTLTLERHLSMAGLPDELARNQALEAYQSNLMLFQALISLLRAQAAFMKPTILIAAAGNDRRPNYRASVSMPAGMDGIVSVAALAKEPLGLDAAPFSNGGASVSAPGSHIVSARRGGGLIALSGTSAGAAHVTGVAALWTEKLGGMTSQTLARLMAAATRVGLREGVEPFDVGAGLVRSPEMKD